MSFYDVQITFVLNPLNWQVENTKYGRGIRRICFGPISLMLYYGA